MSIIPNVQAENRMPNVAHARRVWRPDRYEWVYIVERGQQVFQFYSRHYAIANLRRFVEKEGFKPSRDALQLLLGRSWAWDCR